VDEFLRESLLLPGIAALFVLLFVLVRWGRIVLPDTALLVKRMGRYHRTLGPGPHMLIPIIDRADTTVDTDDAIVIFQEPVLTSDESAVGISVVIDVHLSDPALAHYATPRYNQGIGQLAIDTLRDLGATMNLEQMTTAHEQIRLALHDVLDEGAPRWSVEVLQIEVTAIQPGEPRWLIRRTQDSRTDD